MRRVTGGQRRGSQACLVGGFNRTGDHVIDVTLDVGTWSRSVTFMFHVRGPGFDATLVPPSQSGTTRGSTRSATPRTESKSSRNIAAIVDELERTFVAEIEAAVDPAPAWFDPAR